MCRALEITVPIDIEGTNAILVTLTALTNFDGFLDLSDEVAGREIQPGDSIVVVINSSAEVDLTERRRYTILTQATAIVNPSGAVCTGTDFRSFLVGNSPPGPLPTVAPIL